MIRQCRLGLWIGCAWWLLGACGDSDSKVMRDAADSVGGSVDAGADAQAVVLMDAGNTADTSSNALDVATDVVVAICTPGAAACDGNDMTVCAEDGLTLRRRTCDNGCDSTMPVVACKPASLQTGWTLYSYNPPDDTMKIMPKYVFEMDGLVAVQEANALPSAYVNDVILENTVIKGRFSVETTSDDDYIGFVFGWQDKEHFYLVRWKQGRQSYCGGIAAEGVSLVAVSSMTPLDKCADFWASVGTDRVKVLTPPEANPDGWVDRVLYEFVLSYKPGDTNIEIREVVANKVVAKMTSTDATYPRGRFGFYNHSQSDVRYQFFSISAAP